MDNFPKWQIQEAKSRFSELLEAVISRGPQIITKRGKDIVIILSIDEYKKFKNQTPTMIEKIRSAPRVDLELRENRE